MSSFFSFFNCNYREMVFAERLLSMPKPNSFVFKFLKTKKRNLGDINVPNSKYPQDSSASSLNPLFPRLSVWLMIPPSAQTKPQLLRHLQLSFLICKVELSWRQIFLGRSSPALHVCTSEAPSSDIGPVLLNSTSEISLIQIPHFFILLLLNSTSHYSWTVL